MEMMVYGHAGTPRGQQPACYVPDGDDVRRCTRHGLPDSTGDSAHRLNAFLTERSFEFVEFNGESPAGIAYVNELAKMYRDLPLFQTFTERFTVRLVSPLEHSLQAFPHIWSFAYRRKS